MKPCIVLFLVGAVLITVSINTAAQQNKGAAEMVLHGGSSGDVVFPHQTHQRVLNECKICHSLYPETAGSIEKLKAEGKLNKKEAMNHCKNCHRQRADKGEKSGPTGCKKCHQK